MKAVTLVFKSGKRLDGLLWTWTPESGAIVIMDEKTGERINVALAELQDGLIFPDRFRDDSLASSLLEEARAEGWN